MGEPVKKLTPIELVLIPCRSTKSSGKKMESRKIQILVDVFSRKDMSLMARKMAKAVKM